MSKTIKIVTPDNVEIEYPLASVGVRAVAAGIDMLIQLVAILIVTIILVIIGIIRDFDLKYTLWAIGIFIFASAAIVLAYFIVSDVLLKGQTIGKKKLGIRIIRENGDGITVLHAMIREFIKIFDLFGIGVVMIFWGKKNKRLGDFAASTIVVEENKKELSFLEITAVDVSSYNLSEEERSLIKDYLIRRSVMDIRSMTDLEDKLVNYFEMRFNLNAKNFASKEAFLKQLL